MAKNSGTSKTKQYEMVMNRIKSVLTGMILVLAVSTVIAQSEGKITDLQPNILFIVSEDNGPDLG